MLYFRALTRGLSELPPADAGLRTRLEAEAATFGWPAMHARLAAVDPDSAARLHPNDQQRIQRALEIIEISGMTATAFYARTPRGRSAEPRSEEHTSELQSLMRISYAASCASIKRKRNSQ